MNKNLKYLIYKTNYHHSDLEIIFLLHGYGSNEEDLFSLKEFIPSNYIIISLRAPISIGFNSYAWYSINFENNIDKWIDKNEAIISKKIIIDDIFLHLKDLGFEDKSVSLLGFSQGATLSWSLGLEYPQLIKNILPLSGFYNSEITTFYSNSNFELNCFCSHGVNDPVITIEWAKNSIKYLNTKNINLDFNEYQSGHEISNENLKDIFKWLEKK